MVSADVPHANVVAHDHDDVGLLLLLRECWQTHRRQGKWQSKCCCYETLSEHETSSQIGEIVFDSRCSLSQERCRRLPNLGVQTKISASMRRITVCDGEPPARR